MATPAHCAYCFETLAASLEKRQPLSLQQVELLWAKYEESDADEPSEQDDPEVPDEDMQDAPVEGQPAPYRPAAVSRLLAPSPSSASSSSAPSNASTPSLSNTASSATSQSSSRSSFFSLGRRSKKEKSSEKYPLFVTWNTVSRSGSKSLRGCIGTFEAQELDDGLRSYALTSAFDDSRFPPITLRELPSLECGVTLLTDFQPAANPMDWEIGKHGLRISFTYHGRRYGSTYLPDVAREQGWTKEETLVSLMRKAGWSGRREDWRKVDLNVITYQGDRATLEYREWREWRDWVEEQGPQLSGLEHVRMPVYNDLFTISNATAAQQQEIRRCPRWIVVPPQEDFCSEPGLW